MARSQERQYCCGKGVWLFANRYGDANGRPDYWQVRPRTSVVVLGRVVQLPGYRRWQAIREDGEMLEVRPALWSACLDLYPGETS